jgi:Flp pilus assembly protein TadG
MSSQDGFANHFRAAWKAKRRFRSDTKSVAAIEFALVSVALTLMMVGAVDFGSSIYRKMQVRNAAQVGAQYAVAHGFDPTAIETAVSGATGSSSISAAPAPQQFCGCPSNAGVAIAPCNTACSSGTAAGTYVAVSAQSTFTAILPFPAMPATTVLQAKATVRVQ